ncbi:MAG: hypothetical protein KDD62_03700 [Bdellovibrionales bacterium]|nr:hypothetical protein [Bdellovibrionales bacterium]
MNLFSLFDTGGFPPRWYCGKWSDLHGWIHVVADTAIFAAYTAIPLVLLYFAWKRKAQVNFHVLYILFGAFIFACGITHLVEASIFWYPWYRFSALLKVITALVSWATVIAVIRIGPQALKLPGILELNERLERSNKELDNFAYIASHDLKAPLRAIANLASWIEEDTEGQLPDSTRKHLTTLKQRVTRMNKLLDDVLEYSRAGRSNGEVEPFQLQEVFRNISGLLTPPNDFSVIFPTIDRTLYGHRVPLEQVLRNLIQNALKHHDQATGRIEIGVEPDGQRLKFSVVDDGPGVPPEYQEVVFEMFKTLHPRDRTEGSGTGLAVSRKIVASFGGHLWLESDGAHGSTFSFTWPVDTRTL